MTNKEGKELVACSVCGKPHGISLEECFQSWASSNPLCKGYDKCRISEKSEEQIAYVLSSDQDSIYLTACPGSGKTEVVGLRAAHSIRNWKHYPGGIAALTFTNNAAKVIKDRVGQFVGFEKTKYPHFIGTIDSWLHGVIVHPFANIETDYLGQDGDHSIRIIENSSNAGFLNAFKTKYKYDGTGHVSASQFYYSTESDGFIFSSNRQDLDSKRNALSLKKWQIDDLWACKAKFYKKGFATYQDMEFICNYLLEKNEKLCQDIAKRYPYIIIDECQDLSCSQIQIFKSLKDKGVEIHLVGDMSQSIYEFKKVDPKHVKAFARETNFEVLSLTNNFRSCQEVVDICEKVSPREEEVSSQRETILENPCICVPYQKKQIALLPDWFSSYVESLNEPKVSLVNSAILTRSWNNVGRMRPSRSNSINNYQLRLAAAIKLGRVDNNQSREDSLMYMGRFVAEKFFQQFPRGSKDYHCPVCVESTLRWRLFLSRILKKCIAEDNLNNLDSTWGDWSGYVKHWVARFVRECVFVLNGVMKEDFPEIMDLNGNTFRVIAGKRDEAVSKTLTIQEQTKSSVRVTTIHSVKGDSLDAVMVVSSPGKQGTTDGFWTQWLENPTNEAARLCYVASSRPKHLLVWAIPEPKVTEIKQISELGFHVVEME